MPKLTPQDCLNPGPTPNIPPWRGLTTRELQDWLDVSCNTAYTWTSRGNGPPRTMSKTRRASYRVCDVLAWMNPKGPPAHHYIRAWVRANERAAASIYYDLPAADQSWFGKGLLDVQNLSDADLDRLCGLLDRYKAFRKEYA